MHCDSYKGTKALQPLPLIVSSFTMGDLLDQGWDGGHLKQVSVWRCPFKFLTWFFSGCAPFSLIMTHRRSEMHSSYRQPCDRNTHSSHLAQHLYWHISAVSSFPSLGWLRAAIPVTGRHGKSLHGGDCRNITNLSWKRGVLKMSQRLRERQWKDNYLVSGWGRVVLFKDITLTWQYKLFAEKHLSYKPWLLGHCWHYMNHRHQHEGHF